MADGKWKLICFKGLGIRDWGLGRTSMPRNAPLKMTTDEFRAAGHDLVDRIAHRLARIPQGTVTTSEPVAAIRAALKTERALPEKGADPQILLREAAELLFDH